MFNRRSVLKIGAATVTGALVKMPVSGRSLSPEQAHIAFHRAVFDERFAECRGFAAELRSTGVCTSAIRGDVAELWYDDLRVRLRENRLPVAGLTDRAALFCLEELSRDVDMRVIFRADHSIDRGSSRAYTHCGAKRRSGCSANVDFGEPRECVGAKAHRTIFSGKSNRARFVGNRVAEGNYTWFYLQM